MPLRKHGGRHPIKSKEHAEVLLVFVPKSILEYVSFF